ncbi:kinase-like protein [Gyrodon lividus]|nr:kinase-like protein [Gyrodon lividus]
MSVSEESRPSLITPGPLPDLTGSVFKLGDQYSEGGSFGDVYRCNCHGNSGTKEVAVKAFRFKFTVVERDGNGSDRSIKMIRRELGIWRRLDHHNIVPFLGIVYGFGRHECASLVSSWMPNGTLQNLLANHHSKLTVTHQLQLLLNIANGLLYLHSFPIIHGDLTCNNVLLDEHYNARLTDFGYASLVGETPEALAYLQMSTMRPGTLRWAAPEQISHNPEETLQRTTKSDVYSFGNIALQVFSGKQPWSEVRDVPVILLLAQGKKPGRPQFSPIDDHHWEFIQSCWSKVPERPSAREIVSVLQHFLTSRSSPQPLGDLLDLSVQLTDWQPTSGGSSRSPVVTDAGDGTNNVDDTLIARYGGWPRYSPEPGPVLHTQFASWDTWQREPRIPLCLSLSTVLNIHIYHTAGAPTRLREPAAPIPERTIPTPLGRVPSWTTWYPNPALAPTPPSTPPSIELVLLVPDRGSPGLFGPRSPIDSSPLPSSPVEPTLFVPERGSPGLFGPRSPRPPYRGLE